jgi:DNA-binding transcriptional ArsR family regulator
VNHHGAAILATLKRHGGSMPPGALAKALGFKSVTALAYHVKPLEQAKSVHVTGQSSKRRVSLPDAAKEAP